MRPEKASIVSDLAEKLNRSPFVLVTDYQRMKVDQFGELRNRLAPAGAEVRVVKNSFLKRAMSDSGFRMSLINSWSDRDRDGSKRCRASREDFENVRRGIQNRGAENRSRSTSRFYRAQEIEAMADLPSREVLLAQLLGLLHVTGDQSSVRLVKRTGRVVGAGY